MKAKILATGDIVDVVKDWEKFGGVVYVGYADKNGSFYQDIELEFLPDTQDKVLEGWITKDPDGDIIFHYKEPHWERIYYNTADVCWRSGGRSFDLPDDVFPELTVEMPIKVRLILTPIEE